MLRNNHQIIAEKIAEQLNFTQQNAFLFIDSTLGPDTHGDFPHNTGKQRKIFQKIWEARQLFFLNDDCAFGELGNALHYIQDKWVNDAPIFNKINLNTADNEFITIVKNTSLPEKLKDDYLSLTQMLIKIKNDGIDSWFNHEWAIWHITYESCVYVFADIVEMMLPTLQPDLSITSDKAKLKQYVQSEDFKKAVTLGFLSSIQTNYLEPKVQGYTAAVLALSQICPPSNQSNLLEINFQLTYRLSLEIARCTLAKPEQFKYKDEWTNKVNNQQVKVGFLNPSYLTLLKKPIKEIQKERLNNFFYEMKKFLCYWSNDKKVLLTIKRSENWKIILSALIQILKEQTK